MMDVININGDIEYDYWLTNDTNIYGKKSLKSLMHPALKEYNKSINWIKETGKEIDANIIISNNEYHNTVEQQSDIYLKGSKSNIPYKIEIKYFPRIANLCAKRIDEISINEENFRVLNNSIIKKMLTFRVYWYDLRNRRWDSICIENKSQIMSWPGDTIVSVMNALYNDIYSALDYGMDTLRNLMVDALPVYWFVNKQSNTVSFNNIGLLSESFEDLHYTDVTNGKEDFSKKVNTIRKLIKMIYYEGNKGVET